MNVDALNETYAKHKLTAPGHLPVKVLDQQDNEWKIEIAGRVLWVEIRDNPDKPKVKQTKVDGKYQKIERPALATSSMSSRDLDLSPRDYMVLAYLRSLSGDYITVKGCAEDIRLSEKSIQAALKLLESSGRIKTQADKSLNYRKLLYVEPAVVLS